MFYLRSCSPIMLFTILFGLSTDYELFLMSRVRERWIRHRDSQAAVTDGLAVTARVITAAAAIMVCVFASFALSDERLSSALPSNNPKNP